jgi:hypothetical protein
MAGSEFTCLARSVTPGDGEVPADEVENQNEGFHLSYHSVGKKSSA